MGGFLSNHWKQCKYLRIDVCLDILRYVLHTVGGMNLPCKQGSWSLIHGLTFRGAGREASLGKAQVDEYYDHFSFCKFYGRNNFGVVVQ